MADAPVDRSGHVLAGLAAEFESESAILAAAEALRQRSRATLDALTPRPIEALQDLIAPERSTLPRTVFVAGVCGALTGLGVQWWCNAVDYPLNVGGRPPFSLPAFIPITFEIMVLFAALATFFGVLYRMRLPRLAHPVFDAPGIASASIDRFWLVVADDDPGLDEERARALLSELGAARIARIPEPPPAATPPDAPEPSGASS
jgi:Protein of unknown function (DUF3341)